ncbi:uncharacterized protein L203_101549 [Cryptococcus depauperatus CBS 7841]|uniref:Uncharacterized protein n=1 Tax=Cryptococcus depauperatus CBS 7841 TaxID=1295531 RepID=A0A1E3ITA0_9TREE|nr:hypothetical protein L203_01086 [Cryptococcus depauperatus CBS 7841]
MNYGKEDKAINIDPAESTLAVQSLQAKEELEWLRKINPTPLDSSIIQGDWARKTNVASSSLTCISTARMDDPGVEDPEMESIPLGPRRNSRPKASLVYLIGQAILSSSSRCLSLDHIFRWLMTAYPYFADHKRSNWRDSVRHTLSKHKSFQKVCQATDHSAAKENIWTIVEEEECHWVSEDTFVKALPAGHVHNMICNQIAWKEKQNSNTREDNYKKKIDSQGSYESTDSGNPSVASAAATNTVSGYQHCRFDNISRSTESANFLPPLASLALPGRGQPLANSSRLTNIHLREGYKHFFYNKHSQLEDSAPPVAISFADDFPSAPRLPPISSLLKHTILSEPFSFRNSVAVASRYKKTLLPQTSFKSPSTPEDTHDEACEGERDYCMSRKLVPEHDPSGNMYENFEKRQPWQGFKFWIP